MLTTLLPLVPQETFDLLLRGTEIKPFAVDEAIFSPQIIPGGTAGLLQTEVFTKKGFYLWEEEQFSNCW